MSNNPYSNYNSSTSNLTPQQQWKQTQLQFEEQQKRHQQRLELQKEEHRKRQEFLAAQREQQFEHYSYSQQSARSHQRSDSSYTTESSRVQTNTRSSLSTNYNTQSHRDASQAVSTARPRPRNNKKRKQEYYRVLFFRFLFLMFIPTVFVGGSVSLISHFIHKNTDDVSLTTSVPTAAATTEVPVVEEDSAISFLAVGDNLIHERIFTYADESSGVAGDDLYDFSSCYQYMADTIADADIAFVNQESIIGGDELGLHGYPAFNSPEQLAEDLTTLGFDMVNGATNHSMDMGSTGVENTASIWRQYEDDILFSGIYDSQEDADTLRILERDGITFALLSYTYGVNGYDIEQDYYVNLFDETKIREDVEKAKAASDVIIVSAHWGTENAYEVTDMQQQYAQLFADLGVDLVVGHHPHVIQPLEWVEGVDGNQTLVAYSLGNFLSTMETVDTQLEGMLTLDFVVGDYGQVTIENVAWTPLINHFGDGTFNVRPLSEYTPELNASHFVLAEECPDAVTTFQEKTNEIIGTEFTINN